MNSTKSPADIDRRRKRFFRWLKIAIIIYSLVGIVLYYLQDYILFHPIKINPSYQYNFTIPYKEVNIPYSSSSVLSLVQFLPSTPQVKGVVLYFHGNRSNVSRYARFAPLFTKNDYEVWMLDYPGYGKSSGIFNEEKLYDWALTLYKLARARFSPDSIVIYGKSMGTGIAAELASIRDCRELILETPYYDMPSIVSHYLPVYPVNKMIRYKFPTWKYLHDVTAPVAIFHGTNDWVVPYRNARKLIPFLKPTDEFIIIEGAGHNDLNKSQLFSNKLDSLLEK